MRLPLDYLRGLPSEEIHGPCVYFLWSGPLLLYIGASRQVSQRLYYHHNAKRSGSWIESYRMKVMFDRWTILRSTAEDYRRLERELIAQHDPPYNRSDRPIGGYSVRTIRNRKRP